MSGRPRRCRWRVLAPALVAGALLSWPVPPAWGRKPGGPRHSYDRPVGHRQGEHLSRRQRRRFSFPPLETTLIPARSIKGTIAWHNVPLPPGEVAYAVPDQAAVEAAKRTNGTIAVKTIKVKDIPLSAKQVLGEIQALRARFDRLPRQDRPRVTRVSEKGARYPVYRFDIPALAGAKASKGRAERRPLRVLVSSWIHGDEPVGPATALKLVDFALRKREFRARFDLTVLVKVDPYDNRHTPEGKDPNRSFGNGKWIPVTRTLADAVKGRRFDLFVDLHADVEPGFFLISESDRGNISRRALAAMSTSTLLDGKRDNPQVGDYTFKVAGGAVTEGLSNCFDTLMKNQGVPYSYTMEAPRTLPPAQQVRGMLKLLRSTLYNVARHGTY